MSFIINNLGLYLGLYGMIFTVGLLFFIGLFFWFEKVKDQKELKGEKTILMVDNRSPIRKIKFYLLDLPLFYVVSCLYDWGILDKSRIPTVKSIKVFDDQGNIVETISEDNNGKVS